MKLSCAEVTVITRVECWGQHSSTYGREGYQAPCILNRCTHLQLNTGLPL